MIGVRFRTAAAMFVLGTITLSVTTPTDVRAQESTVDPDAARILKRMTDYISGMQRFSLHTVTMLEEVLESGQKIQHDLSATMVIQRPNKLQAKQTGFRFDQKFFYDGKTLTIYNEQDNYYASVAAPDNIDALLHFARDELDIVPPTGDIVFTNAFDLLTASVTSGWVVGKAVVDGVECDHLAFTGPLVDWQIWIADGERPLPYKYVLTTNDDPAYPEYIVLMSDWDVSPEVNDAMFEFTPPRDAKETELMPMDPGAAGMR